MRRNQMNRQGAKVAEKDKEIERARDVETSIAKPVDDFVFVSFLLFLAFSAPWRLIHKRNSVFYSRPELTPGGG